MKEFFFFFLQIAKEIYACPSKVVMNMWCQSYWWKNEKSEHPTNANVMYTVSDFLFLVKELKYWFLHWWLFYIFLFETSR